MRRAVGCAMPAAISKRLFDRPGWAAISMHEALINRLRLTSGLVTVHLINLSLGLVSIEAMDALLAIVTPFWNSRPVTLALAASLVTHIALALRALYRRRTLRMPATEAVQLSLGFTIPFLLALHLAKTRLAGEMLGTTAEYRWELLNFLVLDKVAGIQQLILLIVAWCHGCIGINFNLRYRRTYAQWKPALLLGAVLVPLLALLGFFEAGRNIVALAKDPAWFAMVRAASGVQPGFTPWYAKVTGALRWAVLLPLLGVIALCWWRAGSPTSRMPRSAAGVDAARPAGSWSAATRNQSRRRARRKSRCWSG